MSSPELNEIVIKGMAARAFAQRAATAFRALSDLCSGVSDTALACPPFDALFVAHSTLNLHIEDFVVGVIIPNPREDRILFGR